SSAPTGKRIRNPRGGRRSPSGIISSTNSDGGGAVRKPPLHCQGATHEHGQHDEGGTRRGSVTGFGPHEKTRGGHRRHGLQEHHRRAAPRREDRAARIRQLPAAAPGTPEGAKSEKGGQGGCPAEEGPVLQARQGAEGADQPRGRRAASAAGPDRFRRRGSVIGTSLEPLAAG